MCLFIGKPPHELTTQRGCAKVAMTRQISQHGGGKELLLQPTARARPARALEPVKGAVINGLTRHAMVNNPIPVRSRVKLMLRPKQHKRRP